MSNEVAGFVADVASTAPAAPSVSVGVDVQLSDTRVANESRLGPDGATSSSTVEVGTLHGDLDVGLETGDGELTATGGGSLTGDHVSISGERTTTGRVSDDGIDLTGRARGTVEYQDAHGRARVESTGSDEHTDLGVSVDYDVAGAIDEVADGVREEIREAAPSVTADDSGARVEVPYGDGHVAAEVDVGATGIAVVGDVETPTAAGRVGGGVDVDGSTITTTGAASYRDDIVDVSSERTTTVETGGGTPDVSTSAADSAAVEFSDERVGVHATTTDETTTAGFDAGPIHVEATTGDAAAFTDAAIDAARSAADDVVGRLPDRPDVELITDAGGNVSVDDDGRFTIDQHTRVGVEVGDTRVTIGQEGAHTGESADYTLSGDAGIRVEHDGSEDEVGVTAQISKSDDGHDSGVGAGVYGEHDDDRVEAGVFRETDGEAGAIFDDQLGSDTGVYASHNGDTVRAGVEDRSNPESFDDAPTLGVFVEDSDGERTGAGVVLTTDLRGDTQSVGTGGVYVDVDGERHDAHATVTVGDEASFTGVGVEIDPGPVSVHGRAGLDTTDDDLVEARGGVTDERPEVDEFGSLDDLLPDELLDRGDGVIDSGDHAVPTQAGVPVVTVHDELGDPVDSGAAAGIDPLDDGGDLLMNDTTDGSVFDDVGDAMGDAARAVADTVGDVFEDLFDGLSD